VIIMHRAERTTYCIFLLLMALFVFRPSAANAQFNLGMGGGSDSKMRVSAQFTAGADNQPGRLFVTATMEPGWHIYSITQKGDGPIRTEIKLDEGQGVKLLGPFQAHPAPDEKVEELFDDLLVESHHDTVVWHAPIQFAPSGVPASLRIKGVVKAQACSDTACLPPQDYPFTAVPGAGEKVPAEQLIAVPPTPPATSSLTPPTPFPPMEEPSVPEVYPPDTSPSPAPATARGSGELKWHPYTNMEDFSAIVGTKGVAFDPAEVSANLEKKQEARTLPLVLLGAFFGGLILNLMPCVLPVIGLKVLSERFATEGDSPVRIPMFGEEVSRVVRVGILA
jgi:suppressor for copper-sensitivity B